MKKRLSSPLFRRFWPRSRSTLTKQKVCFLVLLLLLVNAFLMMFFMTWRNFVLGYVFPHTWYNIPTCTILSMHRKAKLVDVGQCPVTCPKVYKPPYPRSQAHYEGTAFYENSKYENVTFIAGRGNFLPLLSKEEKINALYTLEVMGHVMREAKLQFFLVDGTLLGLVRNHAMIPWDDDIDVAVNGSEWRQIRDTLCCVEGFTLRMKPNMHWRFFMSSAMIIPRTPEIRFPFVDIFHYTEDDEYVFSLTPYNIKNLAFLKNTIFPLTSAIFEGRRYPIPRDTIGALRQQFGDLGMCVSATMYHKYRHGLTGSEVSQVPCSRLSDMYKFYDGLDYGNM